MEAQRKAQQEAERKANERALEVDALKAALEASISRPSNYNNNSYSSDGIEESEEARIDRRVEAKIRERESHYEKERLEREKKEAPNKILQIYPDFNQIVSTENCDYLDYHHPELTAPYKYMPEGIEKWDLMYKMIRKMIPQANSKKDEAKADKNLQKPGSVSSIGTTQGTGAMPSTKLDQARKDENYARMMRTIKGVS